jgi:rRNA maturation RNase YbeY
VKVAVNTMTNAPINRRAIKKLCERALKAEKVRRDAVLSLSLVSEDHIEMLNRKYLNSEGPTDVIAFPMGEESRDGYLLGDVLVCPEIVEAWKDQYGVKRGKELEFVVVHGVLHLLGNEDHDEEGFTRMYRRQKEIIGP